MFDNKEFYNTVFKEKYNMQDEFEHYTLFRFIKVIYLFTFIFLSLSISAATLIPFFQDGKWINLVWLMISISAIYIILNLFRESIIYIIYGRKFIWDWLIKLINLLCKINFK